MAKYQLVESLSTSNEKQKVIELAGSSLFSLKIIHILQLFTD